MLQLWGVRTPQDDEFDNLLSEAMREAAEEARVSRQTAQVQQIRIPWGMLKEQQQQPQPQQQQQQSSETQASPAAATAAAAAAAAAEATDKGLAGSESTEEGEKTSAAPDEKRVHAKAAIILFKGA